MKKMLLIAAVLLLFAAPGALAQDDIYIDQDGNMQTGVSNTDANLEVIGASGEDAIMGETSGTGAAGVYGYNADNLTYGKLGYDNKGVYGYGKNTGSYGVYGRGYDPGTYGVYGEGDAPGSYGVYGESFNGVGVYGKSSSGWAGYFYGLVKVTGNLTVNGTVSGPNIGDITGVTAGTGLTGGGASGSVTLDVDTTAIQQRITGTCAAGSSIRVVNADGTVTCENSGVGTITTNYVPKWNGTTLVTGTIFDNGNVGIGSPAPSEKLELTGNLKFSTGADRSIMLPDGTKSLYIGNGTPPWSIWMKSAGYLSFETAGSERLRIKSDGNVGIGTTNPSEKLQVAGNVKVGGNLKVTGVPGGTAIIGETSGAGATGVYGRNLDYSASGRLGFEGKGVYGQSDDADTYGVYGTSFYGTGVYGYSAMSWAGYFDGAVRMMHLHVIGNITRTPKTGYYSVPAAAFIPRLDTTTYINEGYTVFGYLGPTSYYDFHAPVTLPHGATVTSVTFYWKDASASGDGTLRLKRALMSNTSATDSMATLNTSGSAGTNSESNTTTISYAGIDNSKYVYYLDMYFSAGDIYLNAVKIEYTYTEL